MRRKLAFCILGLSLLGSQTRAQERGFADTTDVVVVEVPVQVLRDGEPVRGLTAGDFEIHEGRKELAITGFEVVDLEAPATAARSSAVPAAARRHFLLLFDFSFSDPQSIAGGREAARDLVLGLHSADLVAVATYHASTGPTLVLGFTSDRRQVDAALESLSGGEKGSIDPLRLVLRRSGGAGQRRQTASPDAAMVAEAQGYAAGSQDPILSRNDQLEANAGRSDLESQKRAVTALTRSLADLAKVMGSVQGRKHVIYLSEGYDSRLLQGTTDQAAQDEMSAAAASGEYWNVSSEDRYGSSRTLNDVERMLEELRRADCVIQAVDIGGLRAGSELGNHRTGGRDSLLQMARGTGGELYENLNDLSSAMDRVLKKTSVTYVLAFQPERLKLDGAYHRLRVRLKDAKGLEIVHRPGFYAPQPFAERNPFERLLEAGSRVMSGADAGQLGLSVLAAPFRLSGSDTAYVPVVIEVDGPSLMAGGRPPGRPVTLPAEIYVYAFDTSGAIPDYLTQTLGLDLAKVEPVLRQSGLKFFGHLDLPPGSYSLRVLVRNGATGTYGLRVTALEVPAWDQASPVLLPPFFPEAPGRWLMAREAVPAGEKPAPYPFMQRDQPYIPASKPVLPLGEPAPVSLVGYNLGSEVEVRSQVLSADGREMGPADFRVLERERGTPDRLKGTFRPPQLEPGEYLLQVTLTGAGGSLGTSATPFVIGKRKPG